jgi:hypothetical protein
MSSNNIITNTFSKFMNRDIHKDGGDNTSYRYALNAVAKDTEQFSFLSNEHSNRLCKDFGSTIVGATYIESRNSTIVFLQNGELHLLNNDSCSSQFIASDAEFGCDWGFKSCEYVYAELKTMHPCGDMHAYWSSGCQYYWVNIDEMLDPVRKQALKDTIKEERNQCSDRTCDYFKVFKCVLKPKLVPIASDQGGAIPTGAYQFVGRLFDRDKNYSNWHNISDPVYVGSENNQCGERSTGLIEVHISNLDCKFDGIELAVIQTVAGQTTAKRLADLHYNAGNTSYTYYGTEGTPIDIAEILIKTNTYIQGQDLLQKDGRLWLYNIKQHRNLDYQRRANEIQTYWMEYQFTYEQAARLGIKSHMRDETYAYGIQWNYCSGKKSPVFHIPAISGSSGAVSATSDNSPAATSVYTKTQEGKYERTRKKIEDTVANPQTDAYDEIAAKIKEWETEMKDTCEALSSCEECGKGQESCNKERERVEEVTGKFQDLLAQMGAESGLDELPTSLTPTTIKEGAEKLLAAVEKRERLKLTADVYKTNNSSTYEAGSKESTDTEGLFFNGSHYYDAFGVTVTGETPKLLLSGSTTPDREKDLVYPDFKNCEGDYLYGGLARQPISHHRFPDNKKSKHYVSKSVGVPNPQDWDADPLSDSYVNILGVAFAGIQFPTEDELSEPLDENNPYTILYAKRTNANKKVVAKGLGIKTFVAPNNSKSYAFPRHAVNSKETVDRNINIGGSRMMSAGDDPSTSFIFHSLDTNTKKLALNFDQVKPQLEVYGEGWRYKLYAEGKAPEDTFYGSRTDQKGASQFININKYTTASGDFEPTFKTYAPPNAVVSPPQGGTIPLMNKFRESSVWIGGSLPALTQGKGANSDNSFIGDVYEHSAPIENAAGHYVTLYRDLPNQYGDLTGITYIPLLQSGAGRPTGIHGPCGDIFIGPHFIHRTSYISDKVGNKFDIPMGQANLGLEVTKKEKRSVCDTPEDVILSQLGTYIHTTLPKDKDAADAKNYAGLHSQGDAIHPRQDAINASGPQTDYYFPKTVTTLVVYWGEFEVNPYLRSIGNRKDFEVVYPNIKPYQLVSALPHPWEESYLDNILYCKVEQPSKWILTKKVLIRTILNIIFPMIGIDNLFDIASGTDFVGNLVEFPMLYAMWHLMTQQIFTNNFIDKMLGVPECKTDDEGAECSCTIEGPKDNYSGFCSDLSKINEIEVGYPMPEPYNTCNCDDCEEFTNNEIYYSNKQIINSDLDAYKHFQSNQLLTVTPDRGRLMKLIVVNGQLIAHTTDDMLVLAYGNPTLSSDIGDIMLGQSDLLQEPKSMFESVTEGFAGIQDSTHSINTQYGYFFVDADAQKIYRYNGKLDEISAKGMFHFFKEHIKYCNPSSCKNEKVMGTNYYSLGVDPRINRFMITKSDGNGSFTMSYDLDHEKWVSFHSYIPQLYVWDRDHMYTSNGTGIWKHDEKCNFQTFFGNYGPFIIDFDSRIPGTEIDGFRFKHFVWNTEMKQCHECDILNTHIKDCFDQVWVRTDDQTTGYVDLDPIVGEDFENKAERIRDKYNPIDMVYMDGQWRINELYDYTKDCKSPIYTYDNCCLKIEEPTNVNPHEAFDVQLYKNRTLFGNYLSIRYIANTFADKKLYLKNHKTKIQKIHE